jgi:hypothetical protein
MGWWALLFAKDTRYFGILSDIDSSDPDAST